MKAIKITAAILSIILGCLMPIIGYMAYHFFKGRYQDTAEGMQVAFIFTTLLFLFFFIVPGIRILTDELD